MKRIYLAVLLTALLICIAPASAAATLYVDASGACGGNTPCYTHPQDAVNNANTGDTIKVYPGTYEQRKYIFPRGPFDWGDGDRYAPALIVWKDGLIIEPADPSAAPPIIRTTYGTFWVNKVPVYASTGGTYTCTARTSTVYPPVPWTCANDCTTPACPWTCKDANGYIIDQASLAGKYVCSGGSWSGTYVQPSDGIAPIAVSIIADGVTVRGLSIGSAVSDYAALVIGEVGVGNLQYLGADGNTIENNIFPDVKQAVFIWHSSNNKILNNRIEQASWDCSIQQYDGYTNAQAGALPQSQNNRISGNTILDDSGICLGAWGPSNDGFNTIVDIDGSTVCCNTLGTNGFVKFEFADGPALSGCNNPSELILNTDQSGNPTTKKILQIDGVTYTGPSQVPLPPSGPVSVTLTATVQYQGSGDVDGSGIPVQFTIDGKTYSATTVPGGTATATTDPLPAGQYVVDTRVAVCDGCCVVTDQDTLDIVKTTLIVKKILINDNGRSRKFGDFQFSVNNGPSTFFDSVTGENVLTVHPGSYTVTEIPVSGYTTTYGNCADVVIPLGGSATCTITNNDKPCATRPCVKLSAYPTCGTKPLTVKFTDYTTGYTSDGTWVLDFGDGTVLTTRNPTSNVYTHTYLKAGTYYAKLTVKNACGQGSTSTVIITVKCPTLSAYFTVTKVAPLQVKLTDSSKGYDSWALNWGDGSPVITQPVPSKVYYHTYPKSGTYTIKLTIRNECSTTGTTSSKCVTV